MTRARLLVRSLAYHRAAHLAVAAGVAVGAAVLAGALLVGDSVRGSLRDLALDRLGEIDQVLVADRFFRQELTSQIETDASVTRSVPAVMIRCSVESAESGARASRVNLHGVDAGFGAFFPEALPEIGRRGVLLNSSLARELAVAVGDAVLVRFQTDTLVPSESVMGRKTGNVRTLRLEVEAVLDVRGAGRFGLAPSQQLPLTAFLSLEALQRGLDQPGRVNALLVSSSEEDAPARALKAAIALDDVELQLGALPNGKTLALQTGRIVLEDAAAQLGEATAAAADLDPTRVLTYLANELRASERAVPYSTATAIDAAPGLLLLDGSPAPALEGDDLLLNEWAARELGAVPGDAVALDYYVVGAQGELATETHQFELRGVVRLAGLALDRDLAPKYQGMSDVDRMGDWNPPFPVDLKKIRDVDEDYWERYRTAPKAFTATETAARLWRSRFGTFTSIRATPVEGVAIEQAREQWERALLERIDPAAFGLAFQPVKAQALEAAQGATDFSGLFIGFSMFLIAAAAMLVSLLFRLGVERRASEVGLLLATGTPVGQVRRLLLTEGAIAAAAGCLIGLPFAVGYGALMVHGLRTWWSAAVGGSFLELHVSAVSLLGGLIGAFTLMLLSIWATLRRLERLSPRALLAGTVEDAVAETAGKPARRAKLIAVVAAVAALGLALGSMSLDAAAAAGAFFGVGALALTAALAFFRTRLGGRPRGVISAGGSGAVYRLGARNAGRFPARSVLSAGLVASAAFVIVAVAMMRQDAARLEPDLSSGDGGFRFLAESDVPLHRPQLDELAVDARLFPLRVQPGEDASCLNLYRPSKPTLLGAPQDLIERGGFAFAGTLAETPEEIANPWLLLQKQFPDEAIPVFGDMNSVLWILHLGLGQTLEIDDEQGRPRTLIIAGLLSRSIFQSQLISSEDRFLEMRPSAGGFRMLLAETDDFKVGLQLEERFADQGLDAVLTGERLAGYLVVENTYLSTFQTLGGLGLLLGTLGLAVVMARNVLERRSELALLQAVGFSPRSIARLVFAENALLLLFGLAAGAGTALLAVAPHLAGAGAEPPWGSLSATLATIALVGLLSGAVAVKAGLRAPLIPSLRGE